METNTLILIALITIVVISALYFIYRYVQRNYLNAYSNARKYTIFTTKLDDKEEIFSDLEKFQEKIFQKSQKAYLDKLNLKITTKKLELNELTNKLSNLKTERKDIDQEDLSENVDKIANKAESIKMQFDTEINSILESIEKLNKEIDLLNKKRDEFLQQDIEKPKGHSNSSIKNISLNIEKLIKIAPYYIFVVIDYYIAVSFFKMYAEGLESNLQLIVGQVLPLAITIFSLILVEWLIQGVRNKKVFAITIPGFLLLFIFFFLAYIRIYNAEGTGDVILELLMFLVFLMTVSVIAYQFDKEDIRGFDIILAPIMIIGNLFQILASIVINPLLKIFYKIFDLTTTTPFDREISDSNYRLQNLKNRLTYLRSEQTKLPEKTLTQQNEVLSNLKSQKQNRMNDVINDIEIINKKIIEVKKELDNLDKFDSEIIRGSNDGTLDALKKIFKIKL